LRPAAPARHPDREDAPHQQGPPISSAAIASRRGPGADAYAEVVGVIRLPATLLELADDGCHWPVNDDWGLATLFCNHGKAGSGHPSYCRRHAALAIRTKTEAVEASRLRWTRSNCFSFGIAKTSRRTVRARKKATSRSA
jgi:hypothetical protein